MITSISSMFSDKFEERKDLLLNTLDKTLSSYINNLNDGRINIKSTQDLERVVRCLAILSNFNTEQKDSLEDSKSQVIVDFDDPDVKSLYDKIYLKLNKENDEIG